MVAGDHRSRAPVVDAEGVSIVPSTIVDSVSTDETIAKESQTRSESRLADVDESAP